MHLYWMILAFSLPAWADNPLEVRYGFNDRREFEPHNYTLCLNEGFGIRCTERTYNHTYEIQFPPGARDWAPSIETSRINCALAARGMECWPDSDFHFISTFVPAAKNPRQISHANDWVYSLSDDGLERRRIFEHYPDHVLVGLKEVGRQTIPLPLKRIVKFSESGEFVCAFDEEGSLACGISGYGRNGLAFDNTEFSVSNPLPLKNPLALAVAGKSVCAVDDAGLRCWDPSFRDPKDTYWGDWYLRKSEPVDLLRLPRAVKIEYVRGFRGRDGLRICALEERGVSCWNLGVRVDGPVPEEKDRLAWERKNRDFQRIPGLFQPLALLSTSCALDIEGVKCWEFGQDGNYVTKAQKELQFAQKLRFTFPYFRLLSATSTGIRARYFRHMRDFADRTNFPTLSDRRLMLRLAGPAILSADSAYFRENIQPGYKAGLEKMNKELGQSFALNFALQKRIALESIRGAARALKEISGPRSELDQLNRALGDAFANPSDPSRISAVVERVRSFPSREEFRGSKAGFTFELMDAAADFLKR